MREKGIDIFGIKVILLNNSVKSCRFRANFFLALPSVLYFTKAIQFCPCQVHNRISESSLSGCCKGEWVPGRLRLLSVFHIKQLLKFEDVTSTWGISEKNRDGIDPHHHFRPGSVHDSLSSSGPLYGRIQDNCNHFRPPQVPNKPWHIREKVERKEAALLSPYTGA